MVTPQSVSFGTMMGLIIAVCIGVGSTFSLKPDLNRCRFNDPPDLTSCIIRDPCCFVTPVFEFGCFTGCRVACHNSLDCERACPVLTEYDVQNCVNTDNHCFVEKLWEEIGGRKCFKGCVKACT
ncbi:uncharacterized protein LOC128190489 [Crassostrea angulata]|uniref:Uncharacterized protein n=1 Tax=Magallana gigas TaxID=29159 RepID=A0A8W8ND42_MAGGI|nr:uncharacterized protein LOC105327274 [Crassostrea gigas]XP_052718525.1 uncharacterized protein LOC128190489 [Crassostrea angulata]